MSTEPTTLTATIEDAVPPGLLDKAKPEPLIQSEKLLPKAVLDAFENKRAIPYVRTALSASFSCTVPDYVVSCKTMDKYLMSKKAPQRIINWLKDNAEAGKPLTRGSFLQMFNWRGISIRNEAPRITLGAPIPAATVPQRRAIFVDFEATESVKEYRCREYAGEAELEVDPLVLIDMLDNEESLDSFYDTATDMLHQQLDIGEYDYHHDEFVETDWSETEELSLYTDPERVFLRMLDTLLENDDITQEEYDEHRANYTG